MEQFSGAGVLTQAATKNGIQAASVDILHSQGMDILKPSGYGRLAFNLSYSLSTRNIHELPGGLFSLGAA